MTLCLTMVCVPTTALAQNEEGYDAVRGDNASTARSMYEEAMDLAGQGRHQDAADIFERLLDTRWSMQIAYNHAGALVELGELLRAGQLLKKVITEAEADPTGSPTSEQIRIVSEILLDELQPRLGRVTVDIEGDTQDVEVEVDSVRRPWAPGVPIAVDPGRHTINLRRGRTTAKPQQILVGGEDPLEMTVYLDTSELADADMPESTSLRIQGTAASADPDPTLSIVADTGDGDDNLLHQWWFWGSGAAVVVGAVVIIALASSGSDSTAGAPTTDSGVVLTALEMP